MNPAENINNNNEVSDDSLDRELENEEKKKAGEVATQHNKAGSSQ